MARGSAHADVEKRLTKAALKIVKSARKQLRKAGKSSGKRLRALAKAFLDLGLETRIRVHDVPLFRHRGLALAHGHYSNAPKMRSMPAFRIMSTMYR